MILIFMVHYVVIFLKCWNYMVKKFIKSLMLSKFMPICMMLSSLY